MTLSQSVRSVLGNYAVFRGRAPRSELWWWVVGAFLIMVAAGLIDVFVIGPMLGFPPYGYSFRAPGEMAMGFVAPGGQPLSTLAALALIPPNITVQVRRLHDIGRSGWWLLIGFVPMIGMLALLFFYVQPSDPQPNEYGPPPLA